MKRKGCLAIFIERQTRFDVAIKIENRSATEMYRAISELYEPFPKNTFKTDPVDRGKEFACYSKIRLERSRLLRRCLFILVQRK